MAWLMVARLMRQTALADQAAVEKAAFVEKVAQVRRLVEQVAHALHRVGAVLGGDQVGMIGGDRGVLRGAHQAFGAQQVVVQELAVFEAPQHGVEEAPHLIRLQRPPAGQRDLKQPHPERVARPGDAAAASSPATD